MEYPKFEIMPYQSRQMISEGQAEEEVLGYILSNPKTAQSVLARLNADCFYYLPHIQIYNAIVKVIDLGLTCDVYTVYAKDLAGTDSKVTAYELMDMANKYSSVEDIGTLVEVLRDYSSRRALQSLAQKILYRVEHVNIKLGETVELALKALTTLDYSATPSCIPLADLIEPLKQRVKENQEDATRHHGPYFGLKEIDDQGGLPESGLVVLAGGTSQGKSALGALIALRSADHGMPSAYFSMELRNINIASRMTAMNGSGTSPSDIMTRRLGRDAFQQALEDIDSLGQKYGQWVYFDDNRSTQLEDICQGIREMVRRVGIRLAIVDYLQLLNFTMADSRRDLNIEQLMGHASRTLKNLGDQLGICIIALCQINRSLANQRPQLGTIRDSGQIAEAADMVIFCWRPEAYNGRYDENLADHDAKGTIAILVSKNREGPTMDLVARWTAQRTLVSPMEEEKGEMDIFEQRPSPAPLKGG